MVARLFSIILLLVIVFPAQAKVNAIADRTVLSINESFTLQLIQTDGSGDNPDLSVLEESFSIVSKSQSQQFNIINGQSSRKNVWTIILMPKKTGEIVIPAITIGKEKTSPIQLVIHKSSQGSKTAGKMQNQDVFIDVLLDPNDEVYVQQKIDLIIRIYYRISLSNLALGQLSINDVIMEQIGDDKQFNKIINNQSYTVIERRYAMFPQKSGQLTIPSIRFEALQTLSSRAGFGGFFSQPGKPIYRQSNPLTISIKKKPDSYSGKYWLPAKSLQLISKHSDLSNIKVGDSITLTDKIIAKGVLGSLLPSISWPKLDNIKTYPDKASINSQTDKGAIYGLREEKMAIIPLYPGKYQLPDRKIIWWNTQSNTQEEKIIPGISFYVAEAEGNISSPDKQTQQQTNQQGQLIQAEQADSDQQNISSPEQQNPIIKNYTGYATTKDNPWFWAWLGSSLLLSILLLISLYYAIKKTDANRQKNNVQNQKQRQVFNQKDWLAQIKKSCGANNKSQTMKLLAQWAENTKHINLSNLNDEALQQQVQLLDQAIYSSQATDWSGNELFLALKHYLKKQNKPSNSAKNEILPLNPL